MLTLPIKKKWFDMILSGEKKEEYREIKPYYRSRFENLGLLDSYGLPLTNKVPVQFRNGYRSDSPVFTAVCSLDIKEGREEWGAEKGREYFVLTVHEILKESEVKE